MPFDLTSILSAGGGGAVVAFGILRFFGSKWFETKFAQSTENLRHQQQQDFEIFKISTNSALDRLNKLNQREYEILPKAWELLVLLQLHLSRFTSLFKEFPDLKSMSPLQFDEFIQKSDMADFQKIELTNADDRNKYYQEVTFWREYQSAQNAYSDYAKYIMFNSIFFSTELKPLFTQAGEECWSALVTKKTAKEVGPYPMNAKELYDQVAKAMKTLKETMDQIESIIQKRLNRV